MEAAAGAPGATGPTPARRIVIAVASLLTGVVVTAFVGAAVVSAGGWEFDVPATLGSDLGRTARQVGEGVPLDDLRIPLGIGVLLNVPLWACFVGFPLVARRREGLDWRRHLGWGMRPVDVPMGLAVGVLAQLLVLPLLYLPILQWVDGEDLEEPARNLVAAARSPADVIALVVLTVIGAPIAEEVLYRGVLFRGIVDLEAHRGRVGVGVAVIASSAVFAASHLQLLQFPGLMAIGAIAAVAMHLTGRLGTAIWIHAGFNATTVVLLLGEIS